MRHIARTGSMKQGFTLVELPAVSGAKKPAYTQRFRRSSMRCTGNGFTLIELLTVMTILTVLFALCLSAIAGLKRHAERVVTLARAQDFTHAIKAYFNVYGEYPGQTQGGSDTTYYMNQTVIMNAMTNNSRQMTFMELKESSVIGNRYVDKWDRPLIVGVDENADGIVSLNCSEGSASIATNIRGTVVVASWGREPDDLSGRIVASVY
jgi:prepilin-type N-terminal cleavage/methylation domain-containing protein